MALPEIKVRVRADTAGAEKGLRSVAGAVDRVGERAKPAASQTGRLTGRMKRLSSVSKVTRGRVQQVSFQLQDIAVQMQAGTKTSTVLAQQLPQLAGAFGAVGAAIGVLIGVGIPVLAFAFRNILGDSRDLGKTLDDLAKATDEYSAAAERAATPTAELAAKFGDLTPQVKAAFQVLSDAQRLQAINELNAAIGELPEGFRRAAAKSAGLLAAGLGEEISDTLKDVLAVNSAMDDLKNAEGIEAQAKAATDLNNVLLEVFGSLDKMPPELAAVAEAAAKVTVSAAQIEGGISSAEQAGRNLRIAIDDLPGAASGAADALAGLAPPIATALRGAKDLFDKLVGINSLRAQVIAENPVNAGRGTFAGAGSTQIERVLLGMGGEVIPGSPNTAPSGGGQDNSAAIQSLVDSLQTEREILDEWRAESLVLLEEAGANELEAIGGINEAKLRLEEEFQNRLATIKEAGQKFSLGIALSGGAEILGAMGAFNKKALKLSKSFAAAQAFISTMQGAAKELSKGTLGFATAAAVIAKGLAFVGAIKGVSDSGSSIGGGGSIGSAPQQPQTAGTFFNVTLQGETQSSSAVGNLLDQINEAIRDGGQLAGITVG